MTGVEINARDFARKFIGQASSDYESIKSVVEKGGEKLRDYLAEMQVSKFHNIFSFIQIITYKRF